MNSAKTYERRRATMISLKRNLKTHLLAFVLIAFAPEILGIEANYKILETADHDPTFFTQGLIVNGSHIIESSGLYHQSKIARYDAKTGATIESSILPKSIFAEGIHLHNDTLYLLTWRERTVYLLDPIDFRIKDEIAINVDGWGLTHDGHNFIQSDGSNILYIRNNSDFSVEKRLSVRDGWRPTYNLNELEFAKGYVWANVFQTSKIVAIDPENGKVALTINLKNLSKKHKDEDMNHVLNGIAYDPNRDAFWVTGKCWNKRYLIQIEIPNEGAQKKGPE